MRNGTQKNQIYNRGGLEPFCWMCQRWFVDEEMSERMSERTNELSIFHPLRERDLARQDNSAHGFVD